MNISNIKPEAVLAGSSSRLPLEFKVLAEEVSDLIDRHSVMVLATCEGSRVTARSMSIIHNGLVIFFQTACDSLKFLQLSANPNVALCCANLQIEGNARDLGHPLAPQNQFFAETYSRKHPGSFHTYSLLTRNHLIEVTLRRAVVWQYDEQGKPYQDFLEVEKRLAWREIYSLEDKLSNNPIDTD